MSGPRAAVILRAHRPRDCRWDGKKGTQPRREPHRISESKEYYPLPHQCDQQVTEAERGSVLSDVTGLGSS